MRYSPDLVPAPLTYPFQLRGLDLRWLGQLLKHEKFRGDIVEQAFGVFVAGLSPRFDPAQPAVELVVRTGRPDRLGRHVLTVRENLLVD
jgi:hypothetical protein